MEETNIQQNWSVRDTVSAYISKNINTVELKAAILCANKEERSSAIERVIRKAVSDSPICSFGGIQHVFNGKKYIPFTWGDMYEALRYCLDIHRVPGCNHRKMKDYVNCCFMAINNRAGSVDPTVVVMKNGVFDTVDCCLHPFSEKYLTNVSVDYDFKDGATSPLWTDFLNRVLPDEQHQRLLQEFLAACFVDRRNAKIEYMMILKGSGSNGKSVVFEVMNYLFGKDNVSTFSIADLTGSRKEQNIAAIIGKRINYCSEIKTVEIGRSNADAFKSLVSGEPTMVRLLYQEPFKATGIPLIMANANILPTLKDTTDSIKRRILIIPFNEIIPVEEQNVELANELIDDISGIFNWVIEGFIRLSKNDYKINVPNSIKSVVESYVGDNSVVLRWIADKGFFKEFHSHTKAQAFWYSTTELFDSFSKWCNNCHEMPRTRFKLCEEMENLGFHKARRREGYGFYIYKTVDIDDIQEAEMDLAIARERVHGVALIRAEIGETENASTRDIEKLEKYLGLPENTIYHYFANGYLDGAYRNDSNGPLFYVKKVQLKLAAAGYYDEMKTNQSAMRQKSLHGKKAYSRKFNERMKVIGEPFRMYDNVNGLIPMDERDCIIVPFGWEYSEENARKMIEISKFNAKTILNETEQ